MKVQNLYDKVKSGELSKQEFLMEIHRDSRFSSIIVTTNSYDDVISILKNKSIISDNPNQSDSPIKNFDIIGSIRFLKESANKSLNEGMVQKLKGGKGDKLTPDDVNYYEFQKGWRHELEHTNDIDKAKEIALDHLAEDPIYYTRLDIVEFQAKKKNRADLPTEVKKGEPSKDPHNQMEKVKKISTSRSGEQKEEKVEDHKKNVGNKKEKPKKVKVKTMKGGSGEMIKKELKESLESIQEAFEKTTTFKGPGRYRISSIAGGNFSSDIFNIKDEQDYNDKTQGASKIEFDTASAKPQTVETQPEEPSVSVAAKQGEVDPNSPEMVKARAELLKTSRAEEDLKKLISSELQLGDIGSEIYKNFINSFVKSLKKEDIEKLIKNKEKLKKVIDSELKKFNKKQKEKSSVSIEKGEFNFDSSKKNYDITFKQPSSKAIVTSKVEIKNKEEFDKLASNKAIISIVPSTKEEVVATQEPKSTSKRVRIIIPDKNAGQKEGDVFTFTDAQIKKHIDKLGADSIEIITSTPISTKPTGANLKSLEPGTKSIMNPVTGRFETVPANLGIKSAPSSKVNTDIYGDFQVINKSNDTALFGISQLNVDDLIRKIALADVKDKYLIQRSSVRRAYNKELAKKIERIPFQELINLKNQFFKIEMSSYPKKSKLQENSQLERFKNLLSEIFKKKLNEYLYNILPTGPNVKQEELRRLLHNYQWTSPENDYQKINKQQLLQKIMTLINDLGPVGAQIASQETPDWGDQGTDVVNEDHVNTNEEKIKYILSVPGYKGTEEELKKLDSLTLDKAYKNAEKLMDQRKKAGLDKTDDKSLRDQKFKEIGYRFR